jgi:hypothetical protein
MQSPPRIKGFEVAYQVNDLLLRSEPFCSFRRPKINDLQLPIHYLSKVLL